MDFITFNETQKIDEKAEIVLFEREEFISFANCGLPYYIGGVIAGKNALTRQTPQSFKARFNIDVRTATEVSRGKMDGFMHIPLDSLREHLGGLPKNKPVYIHCHSGMRSYIACRLLSGYGYDCYNLAGGYRLYETVK